MDAHTHTHTFTVSAWTHTHTHTFTVSTWKHTHTRTHTHTFTFSAWMHTRIHFAFPNDLQSSAKTVTAGALFLDAVFVVSLMMENVRNKDSCLCVLE
jgi:hypothetical protein